MRVGKGALAPCPPSIDKSLSRWAHFRLRSLSYGGRGRFAHPTVSPLLHHFRDRLAASACVGVAAEIAGAQRAFAERAPDGTADRRRPLLRRERPEHERTPPEPPAR